jgi:hypothetical protein
VARIRISPLRGLCNGDYDLRNTGGDGLAIETRSTGRFAETENKIYPIPDTSISGGLL